MKCEHERGKEGGSGWFVECRDFHLASAPADQIRSRDAWMLHLDDSPHLFGIVHNPFLNLFVSLVSEDFEQWYYRGSEAFVG